MVVNIEMDAVSLFRTQTLNVTCEPFDLENQVKDLILEIEYRLKPAEPDNMLGWIPVDEEIYNPDQNNWYSLIYFNAKSKTGEHQIRARVFDIDQSESEWFHSEREFLVSNNQPYILNITLEERVIYRTDTIEILVFGDDVEDHDKLSVLTCEVEYSYYNSSEPAEDITWENQYLSDVDFDVFVDAWQAYFSPPSNFTIGNYRLRARLFDRDNYWSSWVMYNHTLNVMNNPPVADQGKLDTFAFEDDEITFNARRSIDIEDGSEGLTYYWEMENVSDFASNNKTFTMMFAQSGKYTVRLRVTDLDGGIGWDNRSFTIENAKPVAKIKIEHTKFYVEEIITFSAEGSYDTSLDNDTLTYNWEFGDTQVGSGILVNHSYMEQGLYTVSLTVIDKDDGASTTQINVEIRPSLQPPPQPSEETKTNFSSYLIGGVGIIIIIIILVLLWLVLKKRSEKDQDTEAGPSPSTQDVTEIPKPEQMQMMPMQLDPVSISESPVPFQSPSKQTTPEVSIPETKLEQLAIVRPPTPLLGPTQEVQVDEDTENAVDDMLVDGSTIGSGDQDKDIEPQSPEPITTITEAEVPIEAENNKTKEDSASTLVDTKTGTPESEDEPEKLGSDDTVGKKESINTSETSPESEEDKEIE
jgi:PKD repeat protein